jgi:hypothetical protein
MNPTFDVQPWPRVRASAKMGDVCLAADSDGHRDRTPGRKAASAMPIGPKTSISPVQRRRPTASIASPLGSDTRKIPIQRHGTGDAA